MVGLGGWPRRRLDVFLGAVMVVALGACQAKERAAEPESAVTGERRSTMQPDTTTHRRKILFVGTSLTAGHGLEPESAFSFMIQRKIDAAGLPFETVNAGVSGETTADLLQRLDWILRGNFDVLVIETGANDGLRAIDVRTMRNNLAEVVSRAKAARPDARILLVQMEALPNYGRAYSMQFHDAFVGVAREAKIDLLPFLLEGVAGQAELNQDDGVHPNLRGEAIVAENVWRGLAPILRQRAKARPTS